MVNLLIKDLFHQRIRLLLVIMGLSVSLLMVHIGIGMITGTLDESKRIIEEGEYDVYIIQDNRNNIMMGGHVSDEIYEKVDSLGSVKHADRVINDWTLLKFNDEDTYVGIVGYDISSECLKPWDCINCDESDIDKDNTIIIDQLIHKYFSNLEVNDKVKGGDLGMKLKVAGFCQNTQRTGNAAMWCNYETAKNLLHLENESTYLAIKLEDGYSIRDLKRDLYVFEEEIDIVSSEEMEKRIDDFLLNDFGLASSIGILAALGFIVSMIVISITLYQSVSEKLPELVSLKALGAKKRYINSIIIGQTFLIVSFGYIIATILALILSPYLSSVSALPVNVNWLWALGTYSIALVLGMLCSIFSIRKVHKTDPAIIFRA